MTDNTVTPQDPVLNIEDLTISYKIGRRWYDAVRDFHLKVYPDQIYGIVGESGSGKSTVIKAIMRYLGKNGRISHGEIFLGEDALAGKSRRQMQPVWQSRLHMVPQNPYSAMNPSIRIGEQIAEVIRMHSGNGNGGSVQEQVHDVLRMVRLADPEKISRRYPHELSGGMQQRVVLAMAFSTTPDLLMLDEPTTSLDVTTEAVILDLVRELVSGINSGTIYVTHNLGVVAQLCERVTVMYAGEIMEDAAVSELYQRPLHPYTIGLLACVPRFGQTKHDAALRTIPGRPPAITNIPQGCVYADRCPVALEHCFTTHPPLEKTSEGHTVRCHRWQEIASGELIVEQAYESGLEEPPDFDRESLVKVENLTKHFPVPRSLLELIQGKAQETVKAVDGINISIQKSRTLGLVGESGSGKTTFSRVIIGLTDRTDGTVQMLGVDITGTARQRPKEILSQLQMVFQNPQASLNP
ncbi:MAG: ATP-binding cassette domain-containing protein, partial [Chloroflexi bacterium]|nr:ATP-binding cassette domain-containing protein [Chloroflexota bacterium]